MVTCRILSGLFMLNVAILLTSCSGNLTESESTLAAEAPEEIGNKLFLEFSAGMTYKSFKEAQQMLLDEKVLILRDDLIFYPLLLDEMPILTVDGSTLITLELELTPRFVMINGENQLLAIELKTYSDQVSPDIYANRVHDHLNAKYAPDSTLTFYEYRESKSRSLTAHQGISKSSKTSGDSQTQGYFAIDDLPIITAWKSEDLKIVLQYAILDLNEVSLSENGKGTIYNVIPVPTSDFMGTQQSILSWPYASDISWRISSPKVGGIKLTYCSPSVLDQFIEHSRAWKSELERREAEKEMNSMQNL